MAKRKQAKRVPVPGFHAKPSANGVRIVRCKGCGGLVYYPCRLCRVRWMASMGAIKDDDS